MLLLMLCTFFKGLFLNSCTFSKGLFALFCHFFKGLLVAKIQNFLLKGKKTAIISFSKGKFILSLSQSCIFNSDLLVVLRIFA